jgi:hypothetical protein
VSCCEFVFHDVPGGKQQRAATRKFSSGLVFDWPRPITVFRSAMLCAAPVRVLAALGLTVSVSLALVSAAVLVAPLTARGQGAQTVLHAKSRLFPDVGPGAAKVLRDPRTGRYFILTKPETAILIYGPDGKRVGQIPSAAAAAASQLMYAVDFDLDSKGRLFVADRGDNRVKIYTGDGALESSVFINAPMSVVALANGQFAVVTLRANHLVRVMDEQGKLVRTFGNINDAIGAKTETGTADADPKGYDAGYSASYASHAPETFAMNIGKLYSNDAGQIYFAFTALDDPTFRKYDPYGYAAFEAIVPAESLVPDIDRGDAHVQLGANVSGMAGMGNFFSFGTLYSVGGTAGFTVRGGNSPGGGGGGRRGGGMGGSASAGGSGSSSSSSGGTGSGGGASANSRFSSSGYSSTDSGSYETSGNGLFVSSSDTTTVSGTNGTLSFNSSNDSATSDDVSGILGVGGNAGLYGATGTNLVFGASGLNGAQDSAGLIGIFGPRGPGGGFGGPGGFHGGGPGGFGGGEFGGDHGVPGLSGAFIPTPPPTGTGTGAANIAGAGAGAGASPTPPHPGGAATLPSSHAFGPGHGDYSGHGYGHGLDMHSVAAVVKFNQVEQDHRPKPVIHAIAEDPVSHDVWVTIGDVLMHFDSSGTRLDSYLLETPAGASISPVGIFVEPDRLLLVSDPNGVYEFARPDKIERATPKRAITAATTGTTPATTPVSTPTKRVQPGSTSQQ